LGLAAFLRRHRRVALDTNVFIYAVEEHPVYASLAYRVLEWVEHHGRSAVTSTITMTELLTRPYSEKNSPWVNEYYGLLSRYPNLEWIAPDLEAADLAARFRAQYRLRTPDAIQAATAVRAGVRGFISNDPAFRRVDGLETLLFDELL
jgi:predicted nucleic acid-binding protein